MNVVKHLPHFSHFFEILLALSDKEKRLRYSRTFLGQGWIIFFPLAQMLVMGFIFSYFIKVDNYYQFLFLGLSVWNFFSTTSIRACTSFVAERLLIQKAKFPTEAIPLSVVLSNLENLATSFTILFLFMTLSNFPMSFNLLTFTAGVTLLLLFTVGVSMAIASLNVFSRDINYLVQSFIPLLFYATPILYKIDHIPSDFRLVLSANPMTTIVVLIRASIFGEESLPEQILLINLFIIFLVFTLGLFIFYYNKKNIPDYL